ncbi:hypothetical protein BX070DRAFT_226983 [Coemansia spiralis]|nr:hypothetical protein BX070DRAFT_226983 [Coemansia spiralis]
MAELAAEYKVHGFQCFLLSTEWIPAHTQIDTRILCWNMLGYLYKSDTPFRDKLKKAPELGTK